MGIAVEGVNASYLPMCLYSTSKWRRYSEWPHKISLIIAEELCHHFWRIEDEELVQFKTVEILKHIYPSLDFNHFYRPGYILIDAEK